MSDQSASGIEHYEDRIGQQYWVCPECQMHTRERRDDCWSCSFDRTEDRSVDTGTDQEGNDV